MKKEMQELSSIIREKAEAMAEKVVETMNLSSLIDYARSALVAEMIDNPEIYEEYLAKFATPSPVVTEEVKWEPTPEQQEKLKKTAEKLRKLLGNSVPEADTETAKLAEQQVAEDNFLTTEQYLKEIREKRIQK